MTCLAIDIGANGGKMYVGRRDGESLRIEEIHRFNNDPVRRDDRFVWDLSGIVDRIGTGIASACEEWDIDTLAVDAIGADFGFVADGTVVQDPYSYRDPSLMDTRASVQERLTKRRIFDATGITHWNVPNSLYQLHYKYEYHPEVVENADSICMMPQLIAGSLGAEFCCERSIASTTQLFDVRANEWATSLLDDLDIPSRVLPELDRTGTKIGTLDESLEPADGGIDIYLPPGHDTACAVAGLPLTDDDRLFLSTGSWFILGMEVDEPVISDEAFELDFSNEVGVDDTIRLLKNITGFNLLEQCRDAWESMGEANDYDYLLREARNTEAQVPLIDPDDDLFASGILDGDLFEKIDEYCARTEQERPTGQGPVTRCLLESFAAKSAVAIDDLIELTQYEPSVLHVCGGGVRNSVLCQMLASASRRPVVAGPSDATAVGNILSQLVAVGDVDSYREGRELVANSFQLDRYEPTRAAYWEDRRETMRALVTGE